MGSSREELLFDVLFVGGGPANLAGSIRLMQIAQERGLEIEVGLIEKGGSIGAHALSGAIFDPVALEDGEAQDALKTAPLLELPLRRGGQSVGESQSPEIERLEQPARGEVTLIPASPEERLLAYRLEPSLPGDPSHEEEP